MKQVLLFVSILLFSTNIFAQNNTQNIRGVIIDKLSQTNIMGAIVSITNSKINLGGKSDDKGNYVIKNVAPGRYEIKVSYVGYKEITIPNVVVSSGKETILDIAMEENIRTLKTATIKASNKAKTINDLASILDLFNSNIQHSKPLW